MGQLRGLRAVSRRLPGEREVHLGWRTPVVKETEGAVAQKR